MKICDVPLTPQDLPKRSRSSYWSRLTFALFLLATTLHLNAQSYPYWDSANPGGGAAHYSHLMIATTNAIFARHESKIARWTKCGGWEDLPGHTILATAGDSLRSPKWMTVHDHYLYVVGFFSIDGYTASIDNSDLLFSDGPWGNGVQIAKFDLNTGVWTPLGQSFTARGVIFPTTISIDSSNRIYVGFYIGTTNNVDLNGQTVDMLDVSTNDGSSWQMVGTGLVGVNEPMANNDPGPDTLAISALHADGTNLYVGGDFDGPAGGCPSHRVVMWSGNSWQRLDGVKGYENYVNETGADKYQNYGGDPTIDAVDAIESIGTNIYVAGSFRYPHHSLARFSNVDGQSLPIGDPSSYLDWYVNPYNSCTTIGTSLAVNDGKLYLGGIDFSGETHIATFLGCLTDPQSANADGWTTLPGAIAEGNLWTAQVYDVAAIPTGNAVYAFGFDGDDNFVDGFARWVVGSDGTSPTASINAVTRLDDDCILSITGTRGSHWQLFGTDDGSSWSYITAFTLWTGSLSYTGTCFSAYLLTNNCETDTLSAGALINLQFGAGADPYPYSKTTTGDYWNLGNSFPLTAKDSLGFDTSVDIDMSGDFDFESYTPPISDDNLFNGYAFSGSGADFQINLFLGPGTYDISVYNGSPYTTTFSVIWDSTVLDSKDGGNVSFTGINIPYPSTGWLTINCSSGLEPICNGLQIYRY